MFALAFFRSKHMDYQVILGIISANIGENVSRFIWVNLLNFTKEISPVDRSIFAVSCTIK